MPQLRWTLLFLGVVFVILLAWPVLRESMTIGKAIGGSLIAIGAVVLSIF